MNERESQSHNLVQSASRLDIIQPSSHLAMANVDPSQLPSASFPHYLYRQLTYKPAPVRGVDLRGKTAIVTGANTGIGFETAKQLLQLGLSQLILVVRDEHKGAVAAGKLRVVDIDNSMTTTVPVVEVWKLDLSSYASVVAFAERVEKELDRLDYVVLNAGTWTPLGRVFNAETGHDEVIQVNYLSTALLAILLLRVIAKLNLEAARRSKDTSRSGEVAAFTPFRERSRDPLLHGLDHPPRGEKVDPTDRMFVSKLLGQFFVDRLARAVPADVAVVNSASPGAAHGTEFNRDMRKTFAGRLAVRVQRWVANAPDVAARMITDAVVNHGKETHGQFLSFQRVISKAPIIYTDEGREISERLWKETMAEFSFANAEEILSNFSH
ncbi:hypothetical protein F5Y17DRAFT_192780 [Xylariaceae sp. FL0594]|nr:hypothetical protein F5Y17DRAFT_192780 [Xylariaceae sp. FL0594]